MGMSTTASSYSRLDVQRPSLARRDFGNPSPSDVPFEWSEGAQFASSQPLRAGTLFFASGSDCAISDGMDTPRSCLSNSQRLDKIDRTLEQTRDTAVRIGGFRLPSPRPVGSGSAGYGSLAGSSTLSDFGNTESGGNAQPAAAPIVVTVPDRLHSASSWHASAGGAGDGLWHGPVAAASAAQPLVDPAPRRSRTQPLQPLAEPADPPVEPIAAAPQAAPRSSFRQRLTSLFSSDDSGPARSPGGTPVLGEVFNVTLKKNKYTSFFGFEIDEVDGQGALIIKSIHPEGLLARWNSLHPSRFLSPGDKIVMVNGIAGGGHEMMNQMLHCAEVVMRATRQ